MNTARRLGIVASLLIVCVTSYAKHAIAFVNDAADFKAEFGCKFRPELFWGKNISLLNDNNLTDRIFYMRHIVDCDFGTLYGFNTYGYDVVEFKFTLRNKAIWGNPASIARTTDARIKIGDSVTAPHRHEIPRQFFWLRELWVRFNLGEALRLGFTRAHEVTIGAFPFELGRGIALGSAYAVGPEALGFYTDFTIDQFAFGAKLSGEVVENLLSYDLYTAILQNKSSGLGETAEKIYGQEFGRRNCPARGFGHINYVMAWRLVIQALNNSKLGKVTLEPYALYNHDPEQRVEFIGDASSKLGTIGLATEFIGKHVEFGFDYAFNLGHQSVKGWDRNQIILKNNNSFMQELNSHVVDQNGKKIPSVPGSKAQSIINNSYQNESENGKEIGVVTTSFAELTPPIDLINAANRFRNPYINTFEGWMIVADGAWWLCNRDLMLSATAGIASGDDNPNEDTLDRNYQGFIGLQEIYSGKRVKSAFVLGGAGKLRRPLSRPTTNQAPSKFASEVSSFTNLVFTGAALHWKPKGRSRDYMVNPNILFYWQEKATKAFDLTTKMESNQFARNFLGTEINTFMYIYLIKDLKGFFVGSVFIPGSHYTDIRGLPLNEEQEAALARINVTGVEGPIPNLGTDIAVTMNFGLEYSF